MMAQKLDRLQLLNPTENPVLEIEVERAAAKHYKPFS